MAHLGLEDGKTGILKYSATSAGAKTIVRLEIEVFDAWALSDLMRHIAQSKESLDKAKPTSKSPLREKADKEIADGGRPRRGER